MDNKVYILFMLAVLIVQYAEIYVYPRIVKGRMRDIGKYKPCFTEEYRVGIHGYLCYGSRFLISLYLSLMVEELDIATDRTNCVLWVLSLVVTIYYLLKLIYILPRSYFKYENGIIYYRGGFKARTIEDVKKISLSKERKCSYFRFSIRDEEKPNKTFYIDVLAFKNPENIYGILKRESYDFLK